MTPDTAPREQKLVATLPALGAAVAGDQVVAEAPYNCTVTGVTFTPEGDITGATATKRTLTLVNKGADGNGAVVMATLDFVTGVNASDFDEKPFVLSAVAGAVDAAAGDILAIVETIAGAGTANPGGRIEVTVVNR